MKPRHFLQNLPPPVRILLRPWFYLAMGLHLGLMVFPTQWEGMNSESSFGGGEEAIKITRLPSSPTSQPTETPKRDRNVAPTPREREREPEQPSRNREVTPPSREKEPEKPSSNRESPRRRPIPALKQATSPPPEGEPSPTPSPSPSETPSPSPTPSSSPTLGSAGTMLGNLANNLSEANFDTIIAQVGTQWDSAQNKGLMYSPDRNLLNDRDRFADENQFNLEYMTETLSQSPQSPSQEAIASFLATNFTNQGFTWTSDDPYGSEAVYKVTKDGFTRYVILAGATGDRTAIIVAKNDPR